MTARADAIDTISYAARRCVAAALPALVVLAAGCGGGSSGPHAPGTPFTLEGRVVKGPVRFALVRALAVDGTDGRVGAVLGQGRTDATGRYRLALSERPATLLVQVTGGVFRSEETFEEVPLHIGDALTALVPWPAGADAATAHVTPLTHLAAELAARRADGPRLANVQTANAELGNFFGLDDLLGTEPFDASEPGAAAGASTAAQRYALVLAGLARLAETLRTTTVPSLTDPFDLIPALSADLEDNQFDGRRPLPAGGTAAVSLAAGSLPAGAATAALAQAVAGFAADATRNRSGAQITGEAVEALAQSDGLLARAVRLVVQPESPLLATGESRTLAAEARDAADAPVRNLVYVWESLDPALATVDAAGVVTARAQGTARLAVTAGGVRATVVAVVLPPVAALPELTVTALAPAETVAGEVLLIEAEGLNPFAAAANEVFFPTAAGSGAGGGLAVAGDAALNPDFDGRELRVVVPDQAATGDLVVRATYLVGAGLATRDGAPTPIAVLEPDVAAQRAPSLAGLRPASGPAGTVVTLTGANFLAALHVVIRDALDPAQQRTVSWADVTLRSSAELRFALPAGFDAGDNLECEVVNANGHASGFLAQSFRLTPPAGPPEPLEHQLANVRIVAALTRTEDSGGAVTADAAVTVQDAAPGGGGLAGVTVLLTPEDEAPLVLAEREPNTRPGVYRPASFTYRAGTRYLLEVRGPGDAFIYRQALRAPGGTVVVSADGTALQWTTDGNRDTVALFRGSLSGVSTVIEGPLAGGLTDLTSPVTLADLDYGFQNGSTTGAFVVRVQLAQVHIPASAAAGSTFEIRNRIDRAISR